MTDAWWLLGRDEQQLRALAATASPELALQIASGADLRATAASLLEAGAQRFAILGDDPELHDVVAAIVAAARSGWAPAPIPVHYPDDPMIDRTEPVRALVALLPIRGEGLSATLGIAPVARAADPCAMLGSARAWGPLDVGILRRDGIEDVLVSVLELAADALPRRAVPPTLTLEIHGRPALRRRDEPGELQLEPLPLGWFAIANGQYAEGARIAPRAVPHDRMLDVLLGRGDRREVVRWRRAARRAAHVPDRAITELLADRIAITGSVPMGARLDGREVAVQQLELRLERFGIALKI